MELASQATLLSAIVTILGLLFYFYTGIRVGGARSKYKIDAPAITGNPDFERVYRVQVNTLEHIVIFLPLLWLATLYFRHLGWLPAAFGLVWIIGRFLYMTGYTAAAEKRSNGFLISLLAQVGLLVLAVWGIVEAWGVSG
jgi:glutathione S-transferase